MLDFKELGVSGDDFEILVRELLYNKGLEVYWSGKGADGGKDLLCIEKPLSNFKSIEKRWVVQCKHNANKGRAVSPGDLEDIVGVCDEHNAQGYILACSTYPSSALVKRFEHIQNNKKITTVFWDSRSIERELLKPDNWNLANMFFPKSMSNSEWRISTIDPDFWHANFMGNIFYMSARLGTNYNYFLKDMEQVICKVKNEKLPKDWILRLRAAHFDEKNTNYRLYLDCLIPIQDNEQEYDLRNTVTQFEQEEIMEGVAYEFDILTYRYNSGSDHFDMDHKDYYLPFLEVFKYGSSREGDRNFIYANPIRERDISEEIVNAEFGRLCKRWELFPFIHILKCTNAKIEFIDQFSEHFAWNSIISNADYDIDNFFVAQIRFECTDFDKLKKILNVMPQSVEKYFELSKNYIVLPNEGFEEEENSIYTIKFSVHPASIGSKIQFRKMMNQYLREIYKALENVQID